jgi:hypothetical protein
MRIRWPGSLRALLVVRPRASLVSVGVDPDREQGLRVRQPAGIADPRDQRVAATSVSGLRPAAGSGTPPQRHRSRRPSGRPATCSAERSRGLDQPFHPFMRTRVGSSWPASEDGSWRAYAAPAASPGSRPRSAVRAATSSAPPGFRTPGLGTRCVCSPTARSAAWTARNTGVHLGRHERVDERHR